MPALEPPNYDSIGLVNLVAELERRLTGSAAMPGLRADLAAMIPDARTVVLVLFDGLGAHQIDHPEAGDLRADLCGVLDAPFPSTTTVSLATLATGLPPAQNGLIAYKMWLPEAESVLNTIHMTLRSGEPVPIDVGTLLPSPNLWERLATAGIEPIVVQPGNFAKTPLTRALYRGARFEGYWNHEEAIDVTVDVASDAGRFVFLYVPDVDFAAHIGGQASVAYHDAMTVANTVWMRLSQRLDTSVTLVGTADHGHTDISDTGKTLLDAEDLASTVVSEDGRCLFVHGDGTHIAQRHGGVLVHAADSDWWGPGPDHPALEARSPTDMIFLPEGTAVFDPGSNVRLVGHHGGVASNERQIPLLIRT